MKTSSHFSNDAAASGVRARSWQYRGLPMLILCLLLFVWRANLSAATVQVLVGNGGPSFSPSSVSIQAGDTIEWIWKGNQHSSTSGTAGMPNMPNGLWESGVQNSGFTFFHTFPATGSFSYYCTPHGVCCNMVGTVNVAVATATPTPIPKSSIRVQLTPVASGLTAPVAIVSPKDGSGRFFIVQQTGQILILKNGAVASTPFLDVSSRLVPLTPSYDERGLLGFAFHPDFNNASTPGFHKVYTYTSEPVSGSADFTVTDPQPFNCQSVVAEWRVSTGDPDAIDPATRREVVRIDKPQANHNAGQLAFRPSDHYLYISLGDGGGANDVGPGHNPGGNAQDKSTVLGKILRIDPLDPALTTGSADAVSANGKYRVPHLNPFVGQTGTMAEIYDLGLRNPYRFSFDAPSDQLIIGDVGQNQIEEVDLGAPGKNYGWNKKEGSFLFNPADGSVAPDPAPDASLTEPVAEYSHTDGTAVIGGFMYRGALLPALSGKYVFGDLALGGNGRLFYTGLADGAIRELLLGIPDTPLGLFLKGFGQDSNGEMYVLADANIGPSGNGGKVLKIATIPPAKAVSRKAHGTAGTFDIDLLAANPAIECRSGGMNKDYQIVLTFPTSVTFGGASVTPGSGGTASLAGPASTSPDGKEVTVNLINVSDAQTITVTLAGLNDGTNTYDVSVQMGVLIGDVNASGVVTSGDANLCKAQALQPVTNANFRNDINASGSITTGDVNLIKQNALSHLP